MKKQEHDNHSRNGHGNQSHNTGHHHGFKGIEEWINHLDNPEREKKQFPNEVIAKLGLQMDSAEGPPADHRIPIIEVVDELKQAGYTLEQDLKFLPNQYFLIFKQA